MNLESLLKYQKIDGELFKAEQKIKNSPYRKKANELTATAKKAQIKSTELEQEAEKLINEINNIKEKYKFNKSKIDELLKNKDFNNLTVEDLEKMNNLKSKLISNLNILEKMLQKSAESINQILGEFNATKKLFDEARTQFATCKQKLDAESKEHEGQIQELKKQLSIMEKDVDANIMAEYKKKRNDNIFPVIVPLENGNFCGHCRIELPKIAISKIKDNGMITCEHCKRFIYYK